MIINFEIWIGLDWKVLSLLSYPIESGGKVNEAADLAHKVHN